MSDPKETSNDSFQEAVNVLGQIMDQELETEHIQTLMTHYKELCESRGEVVWPEDTDVTEEEVETAIQFLEENQYDSLKRTIQSYQGLYIPIVKT